MSSNYTPDLETGNIPTATAVFHDNKTPVAYTAHNIPSIASPNNNSYPSDSQSILVNQRVNGSPDMIYTWRLSKSIRCFSTIDIFFCVLYSFYYLPLLAVALLPLAGYYGAKEYNKCKLNIYGSFILLIIVGRCFALGYYKGDDTYGVFITILSIIVEAWILKILCKLISYIKKLEDHELIQLRDPSWTPVQTEIVWF